MKKFTMKEGALITTALALAVSATKDEEILMVALGIIEKLPDLTEEETEDTETEREETLLN